MIENKFTITMKEGYELTDAEKLKLVTSPELIGGYISNYMLSDEDQLISQLNNKVLRELYIQNYIKDHKDQELRLQHENKINSFLKSIKETYGDFNNYCNKLNLRKK